MDILFNVRIKYYHNENIINLLINYKTDINEKNKDGDTSLIFALIKKRNENIIKLLINSKIDINGKMKLIILL